MDAISSSVLSQGLILRDAHLWTLPFSLTQGSWTCSLSCWRACCTQNLGLPSTEGGVRSLIFAPQNSARQAMHSYCACFLRIPPPPPSSCFCSVTAQGPRTVEIWPAGVLFLTSPRLTAERSSPMQVHPQPLFLPLWGCKQKTNAVPIAEGVWEAGDPVVPQPPGLPSSAHCLVQRGNTAIHKMWHSCVQHTAVNPFYSVIKTTSVRPYLLMFRPGENYIAQNCSPLLSYQRQDSCPSLQSQLGVFSQRRGWADQLFSQYQEKDEST